jgi:hypothetical protein
MGRHVYCNGNWVWKYEFARQSFEELGIGSSYEYIPWLPADGYSPEEMEH